MLLAAVVRELEIIGEAAANIPDKTRKMFPSIPWKQIVGMRNRLIHAYFDVSYKVIWEVITEDLPSFSQHLEQIVLTVEVGV